MKQPSAQYIQYSVQYSIRYSVQYIVYITVYNTVYSTVYSTVCRRLEVKACMEKAYYDFLIAVLLAYRRVIKYSQL